MTTRRSKLSPFNGAAPMSLTDDSPMDLIFIEGLRADTVIGINTDELHDPQPLVIDLYAGVPRARACDSDRIGDTIDYGVVHTRLHRLLREHKTQLLEAFAEAIADILLIEFGAQWVRVKVVKPRKYDDVDGVGVMIERRANERRPAVSETDTRTRSASVVQLLGSGMVPGSD